MTIRIRLLEPRDAPDLLELYRQALAQQPLVFVTSLEDASDDAVRELLNRAPDTAIFGAFDDGLVGMLWLAHAAYRASSAKSATTDPI